MFSRRASARDDVVARTAKRGIARTGAGVVKRLRTVIVWTDHAVTVLGALFLLLLWIDDNFDTSRSEGFWRLYGATGGTVAVWYALRAAGAWIVTRSRAARPAPAAPERAGHIALPPPDGER